MKIPLFLKTYNSPFKRLKLVWYLGKTAKGVPYFYPRKWVKFTYKDALTKATEDSENKNSIHYGKPPSALAFKYLNYSKPVTKKIGFDFRDLGWKTKYDDYRFEYSPIWSFVFFGYQLAVIFIAPEKDHYWEIFLPWYYETDKTKSWRERIEECKIKFPCTWTSTYKDVKTTTDYYDVVFKKKYL